MDALDRKTMVSVKTAAASVDHVHPFHDFVAWRARGPRREGRASAGRMDFSALVEKGR